MKKISFLACIWLVVIVYSFNSYTQNFELDLKNDTKFMSSLNKWLAAKSPDAEIATIKLWGNPAVGVQLSFSGNKFQYAQELPDSLKKLFGSGEITWLQANLSYAVPVQYEDEGKVPKWKWQHGLYSYSDDDLAFSDLKSLLNLFKAELNGKILQFLNENEVVFGESNPLVRTIEQKNEQLDKKKPSPTEKNLVIEASGPRPVERQEPKAVNESNPAATSQGTKNHEISFLSDLMAKLGSSSSKELPAEPTEIITMKRCSLEKVENTVVSHLLKGGKLDLAIKQDTIDKKGKGIYYTAERIMGQDSQGNPIDLQKVYVKIVFE